MRKVIIASAAALAVATVLSIAVWLWLPNAQREMFINWLGKAQFGDVFTGASAAAAALATLVSFAQARSAKRAEHQAEQQAIAARKHAEAAHAQAEASHRQAEAAEEQTAIQRQLLRRVGQPYVWADVRGDNSTGTLLNLAVGNSGSMVAKNVRVAIDPPLPFIPAMKERMESATARLTAGLPSLNPGQVLQWSLGQGFNLIKSDQTQEHTFTIYADGPLGPLDPVTHIVKISDLGPVLDRPDGSIHELTKAVLAIGKEVGRIAPHRAGE